MLLVLKALSKVEVEFLRDLLNSSNASVDLFSGQRQKALVTADEADRLERRAETLRRSYEQGKVSDAIRPKNAYFAAPPIKRAKQNEWSHARLQAVNVVVFHRHKEKNFVHWPMIVGVPAHHPPVMINEPADLVNWLIVRGMANGQLKRFVKCDRTECQKFGVRERARINAHYCSPECQEIANRQATKERWATRKTEQYGVIE